MKTITSPGSRKFSYEIKNDRIHVVEHDSFSGAVNEWDFAIPTQPSPIPCNQQSRELPVIAIWNLSPPEDINTVLEPWLPVNQATALCEHIGRADIAALIKTASGVGLKLRELDIVLTLYPASPARDRTWEDQSRFNNQRDTLLSAGFSEPEEGVYELTLHVDKDVYKLFFWTAGNQ